MNTDVRSTYQRNQLPEIGNTESRRKICQELRSAREFHEMSLDQVRSITKINNVYLENIESGNWAFLPAVYVKLFIKAYASAVAVQSEEFLNRVNEIFSAVTPAVKSAETESLFASHNEGIRNVRMNPFMSWADRNRSMMIYGGIIVIAVVLIIIYLARTPDSTKFGQTHEFDSAEQSAELLTPDTSLVAATPRPSEPLNEAVINEPAARTFSMGIVILDTSYVKIQHADTLLYERTLWPGNRLNWTFPAPVRITLGNAPNTRIIVMGDTLPVFAGSRRVRVLNINAEGIIN